MTCIIGARGQNGIVIISDRRMVRGNQIYEEGKVHLIFPDNPLIAMGFAGLTGMRDKILPDVATGMQEARVVSLPEVIMGIENVVYQMNKTYTERFSEENTLLEVLIGGLQYLQRGTAEIHRLHSIGYAEKVSTFNCIGSAGPYADGFMKLIYNDGMDVDELTGIAGCILLLIDGMGIDRNVGGKPCGVILKDNKSIHVLTEAEISKSISNCNAETVFSEVSGNFSYAIKNIIEKKDG